MQAYLNYRAGGATGRQLKAEAEAKSENREMLLISIKQFSLISKRIINRASSENST